MNLQRGEKILYQGTPDVKILIPWFIVSLVYVFFTTVIIFLSIGPLFFDIFKYKFYGNLFSNYLIFIQNHFFIFLLLVVIVFYYHIALRETYKYYITTKNIIFEGGILFKKIKIVPYYKITDVSIFQNIIERMVGLSRIRVQTAGNSGTVRPEVEFIGLKDVKRPLSIIMKHISKNKN